MLIQSFIGILDFYLLLAILFQAYRIFMSRYFTFKLIHGKYMNYLSVWCFFFYFRWFLRYLLVQKGLLTSFLVELKEVNFRKKMKKSGKKPFLQ